MFPAGPSQRKVEPACEFRSNAPAMEDCSGDDRWVNLDEYGLPQQLVGCKSEAHCTSTSHPLAERRCISRCSCTLRLLRQTRADQLLVVPREDVLVRESRMRPADAAALPQLIQRRLQQLGSADLFETLRRELADQQLSALVQQEVPLAVLNE